jgi:dienelactone hydrolase
MRDRRLRLALVLGVVVAVLGACGQVRSARLPTAVDAGTVPAVDDLASAGPTAEAPPTNPTVNPTKAPAQPLAVGMRQVNLNRGPDRPLRTIVWYPAKGTAFGGVNSNATPANGRFPLVIFSHGLTSSPERMQGVTAKLAEAGFVVAAPAYPFTSHGAAPFNPGDMGNQPADASTVITDVLKLDTKAGDPLYGHLDPARVGAGGHSAGGYTTAGMLSGSSRDQRVKAAIIISGGWMGGQYSGPVTPVLFIHGDKDATVKYATGRAAYDKLSWPKAFVTIIGGDHASPVHNSACVATMIDFLRWTLYGDAAAKSRLASDATVAGATQYESSL